MSCHYCCKEVVTRVIEHTYASRRGARYRFRHETCDEHESLATADALEWRMDLEREDAKDNGALIR